MRININVIHSVYVGSWFAWGFYDGFERYSKELKERQIAWSTDDKKYKHETTTVGFGLMINSVSSGCLAVLYGYSLPIIGPFMLAGRIMDLSDDTKGPWYKPW